MLFIAALLLLGASVALASTTTSIGTSVRTDFCRTLLASAYDGPIPTTTHTLQVTWPYSTTSTSTSIPTKTVTPEPCTQIITHFSTKRHTSTATVATNTVSTTKLVFTVKTVTDYETQTVTTRATGKPVTKTVKIPTSAGFLPIRDTTARAYPNQKRDIAHRDVLSPRAVQTMQLDQAVPKSVVCNEVDVVQIIVVTVKEGKPVTTTLPQASYRMTTIVTETGTETVYPSGVSTTVTFLETKTVATNTITATKTSTTTLFTTPTAIIDAYAQCSSSNLLGPSLPNGDVITGLTKISSVDLSTLHTSSSQGCCIVCANTPGCTGSAFDGIKGKCYIGTPPGEADTCPQGQGSSVAAYVHGPGAEGKYTVSNGVCGYVFDITQ